MNSDKYREWPNNKQLFILKILEKEEREQEIKKKKYNRDLADF